MAQPVSPHHQKTATPAQQQDRHRHNVQGLMKDASSDPVQVPFARAPADSHYHQQQQQQQQQHQPSASSAMPMNTYYGASAHLQRPPRMPLPIGDASATPGSPIIGPADAHVDDVPPDRLLDEQPFDQDASNRSSTTVDDDEMLDELPPYAISGITRAVPTTIEWTGPGAKVYVTGTFVNWEKKFRLHKGYGP